jgi:hypothetical protein
LLKQARMSGDSRQLAEAMSRYLYTRAGVEATELLAGNRLDRGNYSFAAQCFDRLFQSAGPDNLASITLFKAAIAFHANGDREHVNTAWTALQKKVGKKGLKIGEDVLSLEELKKVIEKSR